MRPFHSAIAWACLLTGCGDPVTSARLTSLTSSVGVLHPAFDPETAEYDLDLVYAEPGVAFTPTAEVPLDTTILVGSMQVLSGNSSPTLPLAPGSDDVDILASSGTDSMTYTIHVHRGV